MDIGRETDGKHVRLKSGNFYREGQRKRLTLREVELEIEGLELLLEISQAAVIQANERIWFRRNVASRWRKLLGR